MTDEQDRIHILSGLDENKKDRVRARRRKGNGGKRGLLLLVYL